MNQGLVDRQTGIENRTRQNHIKLAKILRDMQDIFYLLIVNASNYSDQLHKKLDKLNQKLNDFEEEK